MKGKGRVEGKGIVEGRGREMKRMEARGVTEGRGKGKDWNGVEERKV